MIPTLFFTLLPRPSGFPSPELALRLRSLPRLSRLSVAAPHESTAGHSVQPQTRPHWRQRAAEGSD
eukprot:1644571-Rhodomonas_salina.1